VHSASSGVDAINHYEVLWGPSDGIVPNLMQLHINFSMAYVLQGQLSYNPWAPCIYMSQMLHFLSHGNTTPIIKIN
jgi:hypothetical protein